MPHSNSSQTIPWLVWGGLAAVILAIAVALVASTRREQAGMSREALPVHGPIPDFTLTNQFGRAVTLSDLRGQVWLADIVFTRCAGPCPRMTRQMAEVQAALPAGQPVKLVTLTTDPEFDSPEVMKHYGERFGAQPDGWWFLTGKKSEIVRLAVDGLKLTAIEKDPAQRENDADLFIHSTILVVVDKQGRLRGAFETYEDELGENGRPLPTSNPEAAWVSTKARILSAIGQLLNE